MNTIKRIDAAADLLQFGFHLVLLIVLLFIVAGCGEQRVNADGKPWLADREEFRPAPQPVNVTDQLQSDLDAGPLSWSR